MENIEVVKIICRLLEELAPIKSKKKLKYDKLIKYVTDRAGHELNMADASKKKKTSMET